MKTFSNTIFQDIPEPKDFKELLSLIFEPTNPKDGIVRMWRGQPNANWRIDSSAYRRLLIDKKEVKENDLIFYEQQLLKQAKHKGYHISNGRVIPDFELLALLQHNGAATRLVDFSRNALVGLWFAIFSHPDETGLLFGAHAYYLGGYEGESENRTYNEIVKILPTIEHPLTWEPTSITPRVAAQHSQFIYSDIINSKIGSLKLLDNSNANLFIALNPTLKREAKQKLIKVFDIRELTLFPDLNGYCIANSSFKSEYEMHRW